MVIRDVHRLSSILLMPCPGPRQSSDLFTHVSLCFLFFSVPVYHVIFNVIFSSLFVQLLACPLLGW